MDKRSVVRHKHIDVFKGILTVQMILAHCFQFFGRLEPGTPAFYLSEYINLTTFPGFFLAFGYVTYSAYLQKPYRKVWHRILNNVIRLMLAYYISAFAYQIYIENMHFSKKPILELVLLQTIGKWSEFLLSFALLMFLILILHPLMVKLKSYLPLVIGILSLISVFICVYFDQPVIASLIGRGNTSLFPVLPYSMYVAAGIYLAQKPQYKKWVVALLSSAATSVFVYHFVKYGIPGRFPPTLEWLLGPAIFLYIYYLLSEWLSERFALLRLSIIGKQSLFYLLLSNILIFSIKQSRFYQLRASYAIIAFLFIMLVTYYLASSLVREKKR